MPLIRVSLNILNFFFFFFIKIQDYLISRFNLEKLHILFIYFLVFKHIILINGIINYKILCQFI